jgi:PAS domain S-box-containing protein
MWGPGLGESSPGAEGGDAFRIRLSSAPDAVLILTRTGRLVLVNSDHFDPESLRRTDGETAQVLLPAHFRSRSAVDLGLAPVNRAARTAPVPPPAPTNGGHENGDAPKKPITERRASPQIAATTEDAVVGLSPEGKITFWNPGAQRLYGYAPDEAIGRPLTALVPPERFAEERRTLERVLKGERVPDTDTERRRKDGSTVEVSRVLSPVTGPDGSVAGAADIARDISVRRKAEKELVRQVADLTRSNADLEDYAKRVAHDLQAPLRMVTAYTRMIARKPQDPEAGDLLSSAEEGMQRMERLIRHLLDYARVDATPAAMETVDTKSTLEHALADLKLAIQESGAKVTFDSLPTVQGDATQLTEVFQNLVGNALKYRGDQKPKIHVGAEKRPGEWRFSVRDNGAGIPQDQLRRLFRPLERMTRNGVEPGTGLGLAIARKIIERHGGRIWAESEVGRGATFFFTLPEAA